MVLLSEFHFYQVVRDKANDTKLDLERCQPYTKLSRMEII